MDLEARTQESKGGKNGFRDMLDVGLSMNKRLFCSVGGRREYINFIKSLFESRISDLSRSFTMIMGSVP